MSNEKGLVLGIDLGANSLGTALVDWTNQQVKFTGVRIFKAGVENLDQGKAESLVRELAGISLVLDAAAKLALFSAVTARYRAEDESRSLIDWILVTCQRLARAIQDSQVVFSLPAWKPENSAYAVGTVSHHVDSGHV